jgi:uncharacterized membrane protein (DUF373 family)
MKRLEKIETAIIYMLIFMLLVAVILSTIALGYELVQTILQPPFLLIEPQALFASFGLFLIILIGLELLKLLATTSLRSQARHKTQAIAPYKT